MKLLPLLALLGAWSNENAFDADIRSAVASVQGVFQVPPALVKAVIKRESSFKPRAFSRVGAVGLMQIMPYNAGRLGVTESELWEPHSNVLAGTRLLAVLLRHYRGDVISVLVAYNARPRRLFEPIPQNGETPAYVQAVLRYWREYNGTALPGMQVAAGKRAEESGVRVWAWGASR